MLKKVLSTCIVFAMIVGMILVSSPIARASGITYYVDATNGDDSRSTAQAQSTSTPWKTIQKAANNAAAGDTVIIRAGTYRETVTPANSGVTFKNYTGESVTVSGADLVSGTWTLEGNGIYYKALTMNLAAQFREVFVNVSYIDEARFPNGNCNPLDKSTWYQADSGSATSLTDSHIPAVDLTGARIVFNENYNWQIQGCNITSGYGPTVNFGAINEGGWEVAGSSSKYYICGKKVLLDTQNEWAYESGNLYIKLPSNANPSTVTTEFKQRQNGFDLSYRSNITIQGIKLFACTVIMNDSSSNNILDGIDAKYVSHFTCQKEGSTWNIDLSGIMLKGDSNTLKNSTINFSAGSGVLVTGSNHKISNNLITNCDYGPTSTCEVGSISLSGKGHLVSYNTCYNSGRNGIANRNYGLMDCRIQYNNIYNILNLTQDGGGIYFGVCDGDGMEIDHNVIHDIDSSGLAMGLYIDNACSNILVYKNYANNCKSEAFRFNQPTTFMSVFNNSGYNVSRIETYGQTTDINYAYGSRVINNIITQGINYPSSGSTILTNGGAQIDGGTVIPGITDGYQGSAPDIGPLEGNEPMWAYGHNFSNPPSSTFAAQKEYPYKNRIRNAGFELPQALPNLTGNASLAPWTPTGTVAVSAPSWFTTRDTSTSGVRSITLLGVNSKVEQNITLKANTTYELSGWLRSAINGETMSIGVKNYGGSDTSVSSTSSTFTRKTLIFTTGASNTSATVYIIKGSGSGSGYADDLGVVGNDVGSTSIPFELISNNGFEGGTTDWFADWGGTLSQNSTEYYRGSYSGKLASRTAIYSDIAQDIKQDLLDNGQGNYDISAWFKRGSGAGNTALYIHIVDGSGTHDYPVNGTASTSWSQTSGTVNVTWTGTLSSAQLRCRGDNDGIGDFYLDDASCKRSEDPPTPVELISNRGYEGGTTDWFADWGGTLSQNSTEYYQGSYSGKLASRTAIYSDIAQDIKQDLLDNGQGNYDISAWFKRASGTGNTALYIHTVDGAGTHDYPVNGTASTSWSQTSGTVNVTWTGTLSSAQLRCRGDNDGTGDFYLDDASCKKK